MTEQAIGLLIASPADRTLFTQFLEEAGYRVCLPAGAAFECNQQLSLIISDEQSARYYGQELLELKWRSEKLFLPCLIVVPQNACSDVWLRAGFDDVLRQPLTKEELKARVQVFLRFHEQCEPYRMIFEEVPIGIYRCLPDGQLMMANRAFAGMFGFDSFRQMPNIADLRLEPDLRGLVDRLTAQQQAVGLESVWQTPTGAIVYGLENTRLVRQHGLVYIEGSFQDVTARRQADHERDRLLAREQAARVEAEAASRIRDQFLAAASHELRTPLAAIMGWTQLLMGIDIQPPVVKKRLQVIHRNAETQLRLVEGLLDLSAMMSGKIQLDIKDVDLLSVAASVIEDSKPAAAAKNISVETIADPDVSPIRGDRQRIEQIAASLLSNAIKFTPPGGRVTVRIAASASQVKLSVADTGEGIDPEFLPLVFDRFRQAEPSSSRAHGGLGLGLTIAHHLVRLHGGIIQAESDGRGRGAAFTVVFPRSAGREFDRRTRMAPASPAAPAGGLARVRVLLVEDSPDMQDLFNFILTEAGAEVCIVATAEDALLELERRTAHVLVSDIGLPGEDGYSLIRKVRMHADANIRNIPAIALTAYAQTEDRIRSLQSGYQEHLTKPVEPETLVQTIASFVRQTCRAAQRAG